MHGIRVSLCGCTALEAERRFTLRCGRCRVVLWDWESRGGHRSLWVQPLSCRAPRECQAVLALRLRVEGGG